MPVQIKRIYDAPDPADGARILVDRLWPRGLSKEKAAFDDWLKDVAPTSQLRKWFDHRPERWAEFQQLYRAELRENPAVDLLRARSAAGMVTLLYSSRNREFNHAAVLAEVLREANSLPDKETGGILAASHPTEADFMDNDDVPATFASPACFMHEVDPAYLGLPDRQTWTDINRWRKNERERLIAARLAVPAAVRASHGEAIAAGVLAEIGDVSGRILSAYWPFRGEPDLRPLLDEVVRRGGRTALPVVVEKGRPLEFHLWQPGEALSRGVWNIPIPAEARPCLPDIVLAPVVGYDAACYRLGYGGGFFDRTLAAMPTRPRVIGVGYSAARLATIYPQPHDIAMDIIVTEVGIVQPAVSTVRAFT